MSSPVLRDNLLDKIYYVMERVIVFEGIDEVLQHIIKTAVSLARAEAATIRIFNLKTGKLEIKAGFGLSSGFLNQPPLSIGEGIVGRVILSGEPFMTTDVTKVEHCVYKELTQLEGIKALLAVPLKTRESTIGCITVYRKTEDAFTNTELLLLNIFAAQSVEAIEKTRLIGELKEQATFDYLTSVYNRGFIIKRLEEGLRQASRQNLVLSTIFIDIDDFKDFNDTHGHLMGDKLLVDFAAVLKTHLRKSDVIGRYGGEEFLVITPGNDRKGGRTLAEKLLDAVMHHRFMGREGDVVGISFSAGVATFPEDGRSPEELIEKADRTMYMAKKEGKKRVKVWGWG
ncbi:MAG: GGDEF domain-containing protein [Deltaproteobacteria bacterium]|nr:GGDEF domain-containing protein [Deltaproteobacteria bacterium]